MKIAMSLLVVAAAALWGLTGSGPARVGAGALGDPSTAGVAAPVVARRVWTGPKVDPLGAPSPDGKYLTFVDWSTGDLALHNLATGEDRRLTNKGSWAESPAEFALFSAFSPDGRRIAYTWDNRDFVFELRLINVDGTEGRVLYKNDEIPYVQVSDWTPDGGYVVGLLSRNDGSNQIALFSAADGATRILKSLDWRYPHKMDFSPDGRFLVYDFPPREDAPERDIYVLPLAGGQETRLVEHPANDVVLGWTPDGRYVLFASDRTGTPGAWLVPVTHGRASGEPVLIKSDLWRTFPIGFAQTGTYYYAVDAGTQDVYLADLDLATGRVTGPATRLVERVGGTNSDPDWSPDGRHVVYRSQLIPGSRGPRSTALVIRSLESGEQRVMTPALNRLASPRWSPDGTTILVRGSDSKNRGGLFLIDAQTGAVRPLIVAESGAYLQHAGWSPDGRSVVYQRSDWTAKLFRVFRHDLRTGESTEIHRAAPDSALSLVALSPDGHHVAFNSAALAGGTGTAVQLLPTSGGRPRELARSSGGLLFITWSPDGRSVVYGVVPQSPDDAPELWAVFVDGGAPKRLQLAMPRLGELRFHPDGHRVAFKAGEAQYEIWVLEDFLPQP